jgi:TPR repeat protein/5'-3' exonuclease
MKITLLIDADIIAYKCAVTNENAYEANSKAVSIINRYIRLLQADHALVCLSDKTNWRKQVLPTYKSNRKNVERPILLDYVKQHLKDNFESIIYPGLEADDVMGILSTHPTKIEGKKIIVSEDKDMRSIPGWLYNPSKDINPQYISEQEADRYHLYQTLTGDSTDGYKGCPNIGPVKATKILDTYHSSDWWGAIIDAYRSEGLSEANALTQSRIARICRATDYDFTSNNVLLWQPSKIKSADKELVEKDKAVGNLDERHLAQPLKTNALDVRYRKARDTYNRITDYGEERRFKPEFVEIYIPNNSLLFKHQNKELISVFKELIDLAETGYGKAFLPLALMYEGGQSIQKDEVQFSHYISKAFHWLSTNRALNDSEIWCDLGYVYHFGKGVDEDLEQAFCWYNQSAKLGNAEAQYFLGWMCQMGQFIDQDDENAAYWYNEAAKQGCPVAQRYLGYLYENSSLELDDGSCKCTYWYTKAAKQGDVLAQCYLAIDSVSEAEALYWYQLAALQGDEFAQYVFGEMHEHGKGVEKSLSTAIKIYKVAAKNGSKEAEKRLNELDYSSISNDTFLKAETLYKNKKYIQAIQLFNQLADLGHAESQFYLGLMHFNAKGADEDHDEAVYWFHEAAQQNFSPAQYKLGEMYLYGTGIELNHDEAVFWFNKAAEQKNKDAQIILGQLNFNETLIDKNKKGTIYTSGSEEALITKVNRENIFTDNKEVTVEIAAYNVGDSLPDGSVIFHVDTSGQSGLAAQPVDLTNKTTWDQAQLLASSYGQGWHLPTKDELILLQSQHKAVSGFFSDGFYWSSSLHGNANAWCQDFDNGYLTYANKGRTFSVRAVKSFEHESMTTWASKQAKILAYQIGDVLPDGSIIFHIDISGQSGIAAQPLDIPKKATWDQAQLLASSYGQGWHLPTKDELTLLFAKRLILSVFSPNYYWSSTESSIKGAWLQNFYDGNQISSFKTYSYEARAVRTFFFEGNLISINMLGDTLSDGSIIFHIDASGQHGLAAKRPCDTGQVPWAEANYLAKLHGPDWRLPTKGELEILYNRKTLVGEFHSDYWSSTTLYNNSSAWYMSFYNGYQGYSDKFSKVHVCAVRTF